MAFGKGFGIKMAQPYSKGRTINIPLGIARKTWETAWETDPEWREFFGFKRLDNPGYSREDIDAWWEEYQMFKEKERPNMPPAWS